MLVESTIVKFEWGILCVGLLYTVYAWRHGGAYFGLMLPAIAAYSFVCEQIAGRLTKTYYYAPFTLQLCAHGSATHVGTCAVPDFCVPLAIPVAEAIIFFTVIRTTDQLKPPWYARPFLDALLAMNIDVIFDPVVSTAVWCGPDPRPAWMGLGFWTWLQRPTDPGLWFGVPFNNYIAWFGAVFGFSVALRGLEYLLGFERHDLRGYFWKSLGAMLLVALAAVVVGGLTVVVLNLGFFVSDSDVWRWAFIVGLIAVAAAITLPSLPRWHWGHPVQWSLLIGNAFFFAAALVMILDHRLYDGRPWLLWVWLGTTTTGMIFGAAPYWHRLLLGRR